MTKLSWASNQPDDLLRLAADLYSYDQTVKLDLARVWEQNIRFINGDQYIKYNKNLRQYGPIPDRVDEEYIPRGNDNQIYSRAEILRSNLTRQPPIFDVTANSKDPKDERSAKVALAVHDARTEIDNDRMVNSQAANWGVATGNAFIKTAWIPSDKIPLIDPQGQEVLDPQGQKVLVPLGDVERTCTSPFQIAVNKGCLSIAPGSTTAKAVMHYSIQDVEDVKVWYGFSGDGYTGKAAELGPEDLTDNILKIDQDLQEATLNASARKQEDGADKKCVILKEIYIAPDDAGLTYGRMIVIANGKVLYVNASPYALVDRKTWHPFAHFKYRELPGNFWGITPISQVIKLQRRLNAIDTMLILHRQTMSLGQWLIPVGSLKNSALSGRVGLKINYVPGPGGSKPEKINGTQIGADIFNERGMILGAMDEICGTRDVLSGKPPGDIVSGVSLELIREQAYSRFNPLYESWELFVEHAARTRLCLIAKKQSEDRGAFTAILRRKLRHLTGLDVDTFCGADLEDNTNLRVTAGSTIPRSTAARLAFLQKFGEAGLLGDLIQDPQRNQLFLAAFNIDNFKTDTNVDYEKSKYELGLFEMGRGAEVQVDPHDTDEVHMKHFENMLKDPTYYSSRDPQVIAQAWEHYAQHEASMAQKAQMQAEQQGAERDENAYVQSLVQNGGPNGDPPSPGLFPTGIKKKAQAVQQQMAAQQQEPQPPAEAPVMQ